MNIQKVHTLTIQFGISFSDVPVISGNSNRAMSDYKITEQISFWNAERIPTTVDLMTVRCQFPSTMEVVIETNNM